MPIKTLGSLGKIRVGRVTGNTHIFVFAYAKRRFIIMRLISLQLLQLKVGVQNASFISQMVKPGAVTARLVAFSVRKQRSHDCFSRPAHSFVEKEFPSSPDSRRASCQLLAKEWALNIGKLPLGGLPRNIVVK